MENSQLQMIWQLIFDLICEMPQTSSIDFNSVRKKATGTNIAGIAVLQKWLKKGSYSVFLDRMNLDQFYSCMGDWIL